MPTLDNLLAGQITIGGTTHQLLEIHYGSNLQLLWPTAVTATLTPSWVYGGAYDISHIPAVGGTATATWTLTVTQNGAVVQTATVTPSVSLDDTDNFSYSNRVWRANNRGTNGFESGGWNYPTEYLSAPARPCTLTATYNGTYNGISYTAVGTAVMVQNENNGRWVSSTYDQRTISLGNYSSSATAAPASGNVSTSITAECRSKNTFEWDSAATAYYYETIPTSSFTITSSESWAPISSWSVSVASRGTTYGASDRTATITAAYGGGSVSTTLYQAPNLIVSREETNVSYSMSGLAVTFSGGTRYAAASVDIGVITYASCQKQYKETRTYSSGASETDTSYSYSDVPASSISFVSSQSWATVSGTTVTTTARLKTETTQRSATITPKYGDITLTSPYTIYQRPTEKSYYLTCNYGGGISLPASRLEVPVTFVGYTSYTNGDPDEPASSTTAVYRSGDQSPRIGHSGTTIIGYNLGTTDYNELNGTFIYYWRDHSSATVEIPVTQSQNKIQPNGAITIGAQSTVPAYGANLSLSASLPTIWTSGQSGAPIESGFTYSVVSYGRTNNERTYILNSAQSRFDFGTLGYNRVGTATTRIKATYPNATDGYLNISEAANEKHYTETTDTHTLYDYQSWTLRAISITYDGGGDAAPKGRPGILNPATLSIEAKHSERSCVETKYLVTWDSQAPSSYEWIQGSWSGWATVTDVDNNKLSTQISYSSGSGWLTINNFNPSSPVGQGTALLQFDPNTGSARTATITITNQNGNTASITAKQKPGNIEFLITDASNVPITEPIWFTFVGGKKTIYVTVLNSSKGWDRALDYDAGNNPFANGSVSPAYSTSASRKAVTITIAQHASGTSVKEGFITFTSREDNEVQSTIVVQQGPPLSE